MVLYPAAIITRRLLTNTWNIWCVVLIIALATRIRAQDLEDTEVSSDLPTQVLAGMYMSHSLYRLDAFDCDEPEDVITQSIPDSCAVEAEEQEDVDKEFETKQDYTILQKVPTFKYAATLCTQHRSQHYYNCVWVSHIRVAAPAKIYTQEVLQIDECLTASRARVYLDSTSGIQHTLMPNVEVNYLQSVVDGSITYNGSDPQCSGKDPIVDGHRVASLLTTESLEFTIRVVMVREEYDTGDIIIWENGVSIPAAYKHDGGMTTDFGTLVFS